MNSTDLIAILGNISQSLPSVQLLVTGLAYLLGVIFIVNGLEQLRHNVGQSQKKNSVGPMLSLFFGALLLYLPTALGVMANTAFGSGNVLTYTKYDPRNIYNVIGLLVRTAGLIWFVRGCVLVVHAGEPGGKHGVKGLLFIFAGILAVNIDNTIAAVNSVIEHFVSWTLVAKSSQGF